MTTRKYVVYRLGSNAANQSFCNRAPVAVVEAETWRQAVDLAERTLPWSVVGCWNNQTLTAEPFSKCSRADRDNAYESMSVEATS